MTDNAPTLKDAVEGLGTLVQVVIAPRGLGVGAMRAVIHDPVTPSSIERDDIVLGVGTSVTGLEAVALVEAAGAAGCAAVVFKSDGALSERLREAAQGAQVALLTVSPTLAWTQLHTLLRTATAVAGASRDERDSAAPMGDLFKLASAIASMVGGPTTIEDCQSTVLAYSNHDVPVDEHRRQTILGHRVPEPWRKRLQDDGVFRRLWTGDGVVRIDYPDFDPPLRPRLAIAVRAGGENLGSIWVAEGDKPLGADAEEALTAAAQVAALHLIHARSHDDVDRERRSLVLRSLFDGTAPPDVLAESLDIDVAAFVTVLAFRLRLSQPEDVALRTGRAVDLVRLYCESYRRRAACLAIGSVVYVLIPDADPPERDRLVALARDIVERIGGPLDTDITAAVGSTLAGLASAPRSRREADRVLRVTTAADAVATIEQMRSRTIVAALRDVAGREPEVLEGRLELLRHHDAEKGTAYTETLKAYLDAFGDVPLGAKAISVHQNTFRYRLRRLVEIANLDLHDPVDRLVLHLQLHLTS